MIDPRAVVDEKAKIGEGVTIGPFAVIGPNVEIGDRATIGASAIVDGWTTIGEECRIFPHAVVGMIPQDLKYQGEKTTLTVGARTMIREFATLNLGTVGGGGKTVVGEECLLMAYSHVAHDCIVGNRVVLANSATLAGHVEVFDHVIIGGLTAIHQFTRLGEHALVGGCSAVVMDVPPYTMATGNRAELHGLNIVGLKRRGFEKENLQALRRVYKILFRSKEPLTALVQEVKGMEEAQVPEVAHLIEFIETSDRGVTR